MVLDQVRNAEIKRARKEDKPVFKGTKYLLLRNSNNLAPKQKGRLQELLNLNESLNTVYILKEDLKQLWDFREIKDAWKFFMDWYQTAMASKIPPLQRMARMLRKHWQGLSAHCLYPIHTSVLEGVNNKAKVIKRVAFGYRDSAYFFLKLRQTFPGKHISSFTYRHEIPTPIGDEPTILIPHHQVESFTVRDCTSGRAKDSIRCERLHFRLGIGFYSPGKVALQPGKCFPAPESDSVCREVPCTRAHPK
jgi:hypothetical protein